MPCRQRMRAHRATGIGTGGHARWTNRCHLFRGPCSLFLYVVAAIWYHMHMTRAPADLATARVLADERPPIEAVRARAVAEPFDRLRPTVFLRPIIAPTVWFDEAATSATGYRVEHPFVRTYWTPILGPGATADLLRLATAARRGRLLPRPVHLPTLGRHGLVHESDATLRVRTVIPDVPRHLEHLLPQSLRRQLHEQRRTSRIPRM